MQPEERPWEQLEIDDKDVASECERLSKSYALSSAALLKDATPEEAEGAAVRNRRLQLAMVRACAAVVFLIRSCDSFW